MHTLFIERLLMGRKESNQTNNTLVGPEAYVLAWAFIDYQIFGCASSEGSDENKRMHIDTRSKE